MLTVQNLSAWYGAARILYDLSFEVGRGEVVALMGRNGAGKSTTMKAIMGLIAKRQAPCTSTATTSRAEALRDRASRPGLHAGGPPHLCRSHREENLDIGRQPPRYFP